MRKNYNPGYILNSLRVHWIVYKGSPNGFTKTSLLSVRLSATEDTMRLRLLLPGLTVVSLSALHFPLSV